MTDTDMHLDRDREAGRERGSSTVEWLCVIGLILTILTAEARGEPVDPGSRVVSLTSIVRLAAPVSAQAIRLPIHPGLTPQALTARVALAPGIESGALRVEAEGRAIVTLPLDHAHDRIMIPLAGVVPMSGWLELTFRATTVVARTACHTPNIAGAVELSAFELSLGESPIPPRSTAEFWPPDLNRLDVYLPASAELGEATAALTLSAFAARLGAEHAVRINVRVLDQALPGGPADASSRTVVIRSAAATQTRLIDGAGTADGEWPPLLVTAPAPELPAAVEALIGVAPAPGTRSREQWSFEALGRRADQLQATRAADVHIRFSQADVGGPITAAGIRLVGRHAGAPYGARLLVLINGRLVHSMPLSGAGRFDLYRDIPGVLMARDNDVIVRVSGGSAPASCGGDAFVVQLDAVSYVDVTHGQALPVGFERFPQAFLPEFDVSVDDGSVEGLAIAAQIIAALQRGTRTPLRPRMVRWDAARAGGRPWLAVARRPESTRDLALPLKPAPFRILDSHGNELVRLDAKTRFAELVAFTVQGRDALLVTHRDWPDSATVLGAALATPSGWAGLSGNVWVVPADGLAFAMRLEGRAGLEAAPLVQEVLPIRLGLRRAAFGIAFASVMLFLGWVYPRVVREHSPLRRSGDEGGTLAVPALRSGQLEANQ